MTSSSQTSKSVVRKLILAGVAVCLVALFVYFDLGQYLTLSYLKESQARFQAMYADNKVAVVAVYMGIYILVTALSLPGAVVMTLAGAGLFGFWVGLVAVSFASTIGATAACGVARFLLRDWVQGKFGGKLATINQGVEKEGAFYLFTLRLIPVFPFFVINMLLGLTKMPLVTFFWVSQIGMLPGTIVFVNAGKELAKIESLSGILSPGLIISFVILGLFPIMMKKLLAFYQKRFRSEK